jgi:hypothetical protein
MIVEDEIEKFQSKLANMGQFDKDRLINDLLRIALILEDVGIDKDGVPYCKHSGEKLVK